MRTSEGGLLFILPPETQDMVDKNPNNIPLGVLLLGFWEEVLFTGDVLLIASVLYGR